MPSDIRMNLDHPQQIQEFLAPFTFHSDFNHSPWESLDILYQAAPSFSTTSLSYTRTSLSLRKNLDFPHAFLLLLSAGDISSNPGPIWKHPCGLCIKCVRKNQHGIACDSCDSWFHTSCINMSTCTHLPEII